MRTGDSEDGLKLLQGHRGHASFDAMARYRKIAGEEHRNWYERFGLITGKRLITSFLPYAASHDLYFCTITNQMRVELLSIRCC